MRLPRLKAPPDAPRGFYHCVSRVVDRRLVFGDGEKEHFCLLLERYAHFCGLQILTFCVMGNHFHLLVEVPKRPDSPPGDDELLGRIASIYSPAEARALRDRFSRANPVELEALRERFWRRMGDISQFIKELKQRFSQWHNLRQGRRGTLWEERFKSVLVGEDGPALSTIAAYIDLNPFRAGLVSNPSAYRWSGYGQAMGGLSAALDGCRRLAAIVEGASAGAAEALERHQRRLFDHAERRGLFQPVRSGGQQAVGIGEASSDPRATSPQAIGAPMPRKDASRPLNPLMGRIRHFSDGVAIGTRSFIEAIGAHRRSWLHRKRPFFANPIREWAHGALFSLRPSRGSPPD